MWIAIFGIVINGAAALRVKRGSSINEKAVYLHIMEDVLGWIAVLVVSIVMQFVNFPILDPLLSIAISIWVLTNVYKNLRVTFKMAQEMRFEEAQALKIKYDVLSNYQKKSIITTPSDDDLEVYGNKAK